MSKTSAKQSRTMVAVVAVALAAFVATDAVFGTEQLKK
jgi:hypothetical protein